MITLDAKLGDLSETQQDSLREWRRNVLAGADKSNLWVCGKRWAGSTHIGKVAFNRIMLDHPEWNCQYTTAADLVRDIRTMWTAQGLVDKHPYDDGLWLEANKGEVDLDQFWGCTMAWIDDWHFDNTDFSFWRRFVLPRIIERVKAKLPTIITTQLPPNAAELMDYAPIINDRFVVCRATR